MKRFAALYEALDRTTSTNEKVDALAAYFSSTPPADAAWAVWFLTGRRMKRLLGSRLLAGWAMAEAAVPDWLFEECYTGIGDLAETISLLLDPLGDPSAQDLPLSEWVAGRIQPLRGLPPEEQRERVVGWWAELGRWETFVLNKLLTGELRVGVSQTLVERALARLAGLPPAALAHRLMGEWEPDAAFFQGLLSPEEEAGDGGSRPYPFCLASPLEPPVEELGESLGPRGDWLAEWKWDGIRAQLVRRGGEVHLWSRGEELITERFPELARAAAGLLPDGTVVDGEILAFREGAPLPFAVLQRRIGRKKLTERILAEAPAVLVAYDLLEDGGVDVRELPLAERRARLEDLMAAGRPFFFVSPAVEGEAWEDLARARDAAARERGAEGLMLKRLASPYRAGRRRGDWWKWKLDPFHVDAVLIYAQAGHGRRANLFTDYTFAVWDGAELVPFAKAYSGLSDEEIRSLDGWIRRHTVQRFGPVRSVEPVQVFEVAFEGIAASPRHRSGVAVSFPRISRWRTDKQPEEADTLANLRVLISALGEPPV